VNDIGVFDSESRWISENPVGFKNWLEKHANERTILQAKKWYRQRTKPENAYMHFLFNFIGEHTGDRGEDLKGFYKVYFKVAKTSELTTMEIEAFLEDVRRHAQEFHGIRCPMPNEIIYEE
jgi:hypothetical protein